MREKYRKQREMVEEIQKQNKNREIAKNLALEKWHRDKKEEEMKRKSRGTTNVKRQIDFLNDKYKKYDPKCAIDMVNKLKNLEREQQLASKEYNMKVRKSAHHQ